ncbi:MAG: GNAT family N-acetyltransferase [Rubrivivax sp.]
MAAQVMPSQLKLPRYLHLSLHRSSGRQAGIQGRGIGQDLLAFALGLAVEFSEKVGLYAVVVDAKNDRVAAFYRKLGFEATLDDPLCLFIPVSKLVQARG